MATSDLLQWCRDLMQNQKDLTLDKELVIRAIVSFHPEIQKADQAQQPSVQVSIGHHKGTKTFLMDKDAVSLKKSLNGLARFQADLIIEKSGERFNVQFKKLGIFLVKAMRLYPFVKDKIVQNLIEKVPHRNTPLEAHLLY
jgi:hypothetical protein